jgi:hypothetical protein
MLPMDENHFRPNLMTNRIRNNSRTVRNGRSWSTEHEVGLWDGDTAFGRRRHIASIFTRGPSRQHRKSIITRKR